MSNNVKGGHKEKQSYANTRTTGKEQYYTQTNVVDLCLEKIQEHIDLQGKMILEPCGGTGEFVEGFMRIGIPSDKIVSYDIEPKHHMVKLGNYLETQFEETNYVSITNPPFGRASSLAKKFFNHAAGHSDYICYLIPKSWRKIQPVKKEVKDRNGKLVKRPDYVTGANFEIIVFGHSCGKCKELDPTQQHDAKTTTMYLNVERQDVKDFLKLHDYSTYYNNVAYVSALSIQEINYELNKHFNMPNFIFN